MTTPAIVALATPTGRSGIGVVRLSGAGSLSIIRNLLGQNGFSPEPRTAFLRSLVDPSSEEVIDESIVTYFKAPHSFTGEDVIEISCHGSPILLRRVIDICLALGARLAEPGEFSLRALANGRMNLAEVEAIRDLIDAQTVASARQAVRQMRGEFSHQLQPIKDELLDVIVLLESALEFVEDDLPETHSDSVKSRLSKIAADIRGIAATFHAGKLIRDGLRVALVGRPNVGKSSLFNALLGSDRAIVTEIAGTTRDQIHERFTIGDVPISLIDTAGLRETDDTVESIGVERSKRAMADADLVLVLFDASEKLTKEDGEILESVGELNHLIVINKIDKAEQAQISDLKSKISNLKFEISDSKSAVSGSKAGDMKPRPKIAHQGSTVQDRVPISGMPLTDDAELVSVSAKTGDGLVDLKKAMVEPFSPQEISSNGFLVSDARHHDLLVRAGDEIVHSVVLLDQKASEEIVLIGLHNSLRYLGQITGETTTEDMLTRIFSTFCIGK